MKHHVKDGRIREGGGGSQTMVRDNVVQGGLPILMEYWRGAGCPMGKWHTQFLRRA